MAQVPLGKGSSYKSRKEDFVSNLSGGSLLEVNLVTLVAPLAILLWSALQSHQSFFNPYGPVALAADFLLNVCAILFATTAYSSAPTLLCVLLVLPAIIALLQRNNIKSKKSSKRSEASLQENGSASKVTTSKLGAVPIRPFLTNYRGGMMAITCIAILAVDFRVFPRRFAKVENWGTSLMDLGVGSFVFSAGVVSARSIIISKSSSPSSSTFFLKRLLISLRHSLPLFVLGLVRLYSVKGLDYAEHVTEYGVHWNFFFTLAFIPPFVELSDLITSHLPLTYDILAFLIAATYEIILNTTSLKSYILISPRGPDLLSKNREGVFSFIGYLAIFLAGRGTGLVVLAPATSPPKTKSKFSAEEHARRGRRALLKNLAIQSFAYITLYIISTTWALAALSVSRRLANLPYVLWIAAFNNAQLTLFCTIETFTLPEAYISQDDAKGLASASSRIMQAFNKNGLVVFLVANLLTGLVNLTINTLDMGNGGAMAILLAYVTVLTGFALGLDAAGVRLKL